MQPNDISPLPISVLISGNGSNLQAIIDAIAANTLPATIVNVISNRANAFGLQRAERAGINTVTLSTNDYPDRTAFDRALHDCLANTPATLFVLAGFMHILPDTTVNQYLGRLINIHPSLLPKYRGLHTHQQVLTAGDNQHGTSVHFVTAELDAGPIIAQARFNVPANATEQSLKAVCQTAEHRLLPQVIGWIAAQRLVYQHNTVLFDQHPLPKQGLQFDAALQPYQTEQ